MGKHGDGPFVSVSLCVSVVEPGDRNKRTVPVLLAGNDSQTVLYFFYLESLNMTNEIRA